MFYKNIFDICVKTLSTTSFFYIAVNTTLITFDILKKNILFKK